MIKNNIPRNINLSGTIEAFLAFIHYIVAQKNTLIYKTYTVLYFCQMDDLRKTSTFKLKTFKNG